MKYVEMLVPTSSDDLGIHTFKVGLMTAGSQTIMATDTVTTTFTSKSSIKVTPRSREPSESHSCRQQHRRRGV
jgi:hypothetical protein